MCKVLNLVRKAHTFCIIKRPETPKTTLLGLFLTDALILREELLRDILRERNCGEIFF